MKSISTYFHPVKGFIIMAFVFCLSHTDAYGYYDQFTGIYIDGAKWTEREIVREIDPVSGKLISKIGNSATYGFGRNNTAFQNPESINTIETKIIIVKAILDDGTDRESFARIDGRFYNSLNSGTEKGDIWAGVHIGDKGSGLQAWWDVFEATDDSGDTWEEKGSGILVVPGDIIIGNEYTAKIEYDGDQDFTFSVGNEEESFTGPAKITNSFLAYKGLVTGSFSTGGSGNGFTHAEFDDVYINSSNTVYDDFNTQPLDDTKWKSLEAVKEISSGKLRLNVQASDTQADIDIKPINQEVKYLEAQMMINSDSKLSAGTTGVIRIAGWFYNDSRGDGSGLPYDGNKGDVWIRHWIAMRDSKLSVECYIDRCDSAIANGSWTTLFSQTFLKPVSFNKTYTLSIEQIGKTFHFKCGDELHTYTVTTPMYLPSEGQFRYFQTRIYAGAGQSGYIKTTLDNVRLKKSGLFFPVKSRSGKISIIYLE